MMTTVVEEVAMTDSRLRVGDDDRDAAVAALGEHLAAGRITQDEYDERVDRAWAARFDTDLDQLFADLPSRQPYGEIDVAPSATGRYEIFDGLEIWPSRWRTPFVLLLIGGVIFVAAFAAIGLAFVVFIFGF